MKAYGEWRCTSTDFNLDTNCRWMCQLHGLVCDLVWTCLYPENGGSRLAWNVDESQRPALHKAAEGKVVWKKNDIVSNTELHCEQYRVTLWEIQSYIVSNTELHCEKYRVTLWAIQSYIVSNTELLCEKYRVTLWAIQSYIVRNTELHCEQ